LGFGFIIDGVNDMKEIGDTVHFYISPGDLRYETITYINDRHCKVSGRWWDVTDLYDSEEEAKAGLSAEGRRMEGCLREAEIIATPLSGEVSTILAIGFKLFGCGGQ